MYKNIIKLHKPIPSARQDDQQERDDKDDEDDDKEMTEEEAKKAALYRWAKENYVYSDDKTYV